MVAAETRSMLSLEGGEMLRSEQPRRVRPEGLGVVLSLSAACLLAALVLIATQNGGAVELNQASHIKRWMNTLKGAESFLDDAEKGQLPAKSVVPANDDLDDVEQLLKKTKEQVHREATRLHKLEEPEKGPKMPFGAKKVQLLTAPGEANEGFQGTARRDVRPGQVMREVTDMVDDYKSEEDEAAKQLLREIGSKIVEAFDSHGLSASQIAREVADDVDEKNEEGEAEERAEGSASLKDTSSSSSGGMPVSGVTVDTLMGRETPDVGVADCSDLPGLPKSSKFCLEGRPRSKLPGMDSAMTSGDMRAKIKELKRQARQNMGLPNADKVDQEELSKLQDIVSSTKKALGEQEGRLKEIKDSKQTAMQDLNAQKRILVMAQKARKQRLAWRHLDSAMTTAYHDAGFQLPLSH